ncbi:MAG: DUF1501 domain-containing protein [Gemmataceae bacterium]
MIPRAQDPGEPGSRFGCGAAPATSTPFDPKPEAGEGVLWSAESAHRHHPAGTVISELMPQLATQFDKYSIIRSMTHGNNSHETAAYLVQTGRIPAIAWSIPTAGGRFPFRGRSVERLGLLPPYIVLTQPQGRFDEAGFLGNRYKPFATGGDPNAASWWRDWSAS